MPKQRKYDVGTVCGKWTILERPFGSNKALMRCECGTEKWNYVSNISSHNSLQCRRCLTQEPKVVVFNAVIATAKRRGLVWNLSVEDWWEIASSRCHYCTASPSNFHTKAGLNYNGVDRVDSSIRSYDKGNVVPACRICNRAKSDMTTDEFYDWIKRINDKASL